MSPLPLFPASLSPTSSLAPSPPPQQRYVSLKASPTPQDPTAQCHLLITILDHLSLLFQASGASGSQMAAVLLK